jgi:hypothetical protein
MEHQEIGWVGTDQANRPRYTKQRQGSYKHGNGLARSTKCEDFLSN